MKYLNNVEIKETAKSADIKMWQIAKEIGVNRNTLGSWFHDELTGERLKKVNTALKALIEDKKRALSKIV